MGEKNRVGPKINIWNRQDEDERKIKVEIDIGAKMGTPPRGGQLADTAVGIA